MTTPAPPMCLVCIHAREGFVCAAFPQGIPAEILFGRADHRQPFEGDQGVRFEPHPQATPAQLDLTLAPYDEPRRPRSPLIA